MKTSKPTFVSLLSALFVIAGTFTPGYAQQKKAAPTGADCLQQATAAADKVKKSGGTDKEQQAAYERAKHNCRGRM
jgi:hypothetical protein